MGQDAQVGIQRRKIGGGGQDRPCIGRGGPCGGGSERIDMQRGQGRADPRAGVRVGRVTGHLRADGAARHPRGHHRAQAAVGPQQGGLPMRHGRSRADKRLVEARPGHDLQNPSRLAVKVETGHQPSPRLVTQQNQVACGQMRLHAGHAPQGVLSPCRVQEPRKAAQMTVQPRRDDDHAAVGQHHDIGVVAPTGPAAFLDIPVGGIGIGGQRLSVRGQERRDAADPGFVAQIGRLQCVTPQGRRHRLRVQHQRQTGQRRITVADRAISRRQHAAPPHPDHDPAAPTDGHSVPRAPAGRHGCPVRPPGPPPGTRCGPRGRPGTGHG